MKDKGLGIAIAIGIVIFALVFAATDGFAGRAVATSNVTVQGADPTANDDLTRGFLPGHIWVNDSNGNGWLLVDATDGTASWINITD